MKKLYLWVAPGSFVVEEPNRIVPFVASHRSLSCDRLLQAACDQLVLSSTDFRCGRLVLVLCRVGCVVLMLVLSLLGPERVLVIRVFPVFDRGNLEHAENVVFVREAGGLLATDSPLLGQPHRLVPRQSQR